VIEKMVKMSLKKVWVKEKFSKIEDKKKTKRSKFNFEFPVQDLKI